MAPGRTLDEIVDDAITVNLASGTVYGVNEMMAMARAIAVAAVVKACGSQSEAERLLGIDQATISRMVRKVRTATVNSDYPLEGVGERLHRSVDNGAAALRRLETDGV